MVTGSEKQMKWYEEILKEAYDYLDARYNHIHPEAGIY